MRKILLPLVMLAISGPMLSQAADKSPGPQRTERYWLQADYERDREAYEKKRDADYDEGRVLDIVGVKPGMTVGEVGVGNGYFTLKLARRIGPSGKVYANEIVEDFLAELRDRTKQQGLSNIETILGTKTDPRLPTGRLDMVFLVRVLHDLDKPVEVMENVAASLKPGAKVIIVETEDKVQDGKRSLQTRQQFLDVIARARFAVERIDKSLPNPRSVVFILAPK